MKLFKSSKPDTLWKFSQKGNLWRFVFAGDLIAGETRDTENKLLYLFTFDMNTGKRFLSDFLFEDGNFWISVEGGNNNILFLTRYKNPELPYHTGIIALDIKSGKLLWENKDYEFYFCTSDKLYGVKQQFENPAFAELDMTQGNIIRNIDKAQNGLLMEMKMRADSDIIYEATNYPLVLSQNLPDEKYSSLIRKEISSKKVDGEIEYIIRDNYLMFNYYVENPVDPKDIMRKTYKNIFCIYNVSDEKRIFEDELNQHSGCNVPDNFFIKNNMLIYLKEKKDIIALKLD